MNTNPIPYRIRIGVTGHRSIKDPAAVAEQVRLVLDNRIPELFDDYPNVPLLKKGSKTKTPIQFCVITALAEGADRMVAREILKRDASKIEAVLPLSPKDYLNDFAGQESKREFTGLLKQDPNPTFLRNKTLKKQFPLHDDKKLKEERNQAYYNAGEYIVDHCDVLIAVWDGQEAKSKGGTGDIAAYARKRKCPLIIIPAIQNDAVQIKKAGAVKNNKKSIKIVNGRRGLSYNDYCRLEKYNTHSIASMKLDKEEEKNNKDFLGSFSPRLVNQQNQKHIRETILPEYTRASIVAQDNRHWYFLAGLLAYVLSPVAVFVVVLGIHSPHQSSQAAFIIELIILLIILYVIFIANRKKVHKKWIEARFLSERLRSSIYLTMFGVKPSNLNRDSMRRTSLLNVGWPMRAYYDILSDSGGFALRSTFNINAAKKALCKNWIIPQIEYHKGKKHDSEIKSRILEFGGKIAFGAAVLAALTHVFLSFFIHDKTPTWVENGIVALAILLPAFGSAIGAIRTHREYSHLEKCSGIMKSNLDELQLLYDKIKTREQLFQVLQYTDEIMLQEIQDWYMLMRPVDLNPV